tara:strand:- start:47 stop:283 length:237 start_codon:yes stop_codon:yes gene_type:complete
MILKLFNKVYSIHKKRLRKKKIIENLKIECFNYRYALINLCLKYSDEGLKQGRFNYRVKKNVRLLKRRELQLSKLKKR